MEFWSVLLTAIPALLAIALVATALEQIALLGLDNLGVPLAVAGLWQLLTPAG